ncbi:LamG-like jellyroll fold domain-containing protein [Streptomyces sp. PT12]|uniref:LamG-like jellyroll fold domain-containing protein n=1 Tax=Streptomyces sp. PT12 TaxID=1510197 RepID=UPI0011BE8E8E|nr:LamG-like jellyroll fold domain-containing protein [Streptomyces sp. PT12]
MRDADGGWADVDPTLQVLPGGGLVPAAAALDVVVSEGGDQPMVSLSAVGGRDLTVDWPGELPAPEVSGNVAVYPEVLPGVDLRVRVEADNVSHVLVVKTPEAAADPALDELVLPVSGEGLEVRPNEEGGLEAVDEGAGGVVFSAPQPMMWDSSSAATAPEGAGARGATATADEDPADGPGDAARLAPVTAEVSSDGGSVVLSPDQELLRGEETAYPVYIDPQWEAPRATEWGMVSSYHPNSSFYKFSGSEGVGMCPFDYDPNCNYRDVKRLFYQIPTSRFAGKSIITAEFVIRNNHSFNCTPQQVELWRTRDVSAGTTWSKQEADGYWIDRQQTLNEAHGYGSDCPAGDMEFWAGRAVADAARNGWSSVTFGLQASVETGYQAWKRFDDSAYLRVNYNRPPSQPRIADLSMHPGGACVRIGDATWTNALPRVYAEARDPDGDDVAVQFRVGRHTGSSFDVLWTSARSTAAASGSSFSYQLPSTLPRGDLLGWGVRAWDGYAWGPWSYAGSATACYFRYDPTKPAGPAIDSDQYPESDPQNPQDPWLNGVGRYGTFTLDSASSDVVRYTYGINGNPDPRNVVATSGGAAREVSFMPTEVGVNWVTAQAFDAAGNVSSISTYRFRVRTGQPERAAFGLDEEPGAAETVGRGGAYEATLSGGAQPGGEGVTGTGLHLDGVDDHARTPGGVVDTTHSFSVAFWARLPEDKEDRSMVAVSQVGANRSSFELHHSSAYGGWVLYRQTNDELDGTQAVRAAQPACPAGDTACQDARLGEWTHVVGVTNVADGAMRLYVDGARVASAVYTTHWDAGASLLLGASAHRGTATNFFAGDLDQVRLYDYALDDADVAALHDGQPVATPERPAEAIWELDEPADAALVTGRGENLPATLHGGAGLGGEGVSGTGLHLDGVDDYAVHPLPPVNTFNSFSVSLWARLPDDKPDVPMAAVTQESSGNAAFEIYHSTALGGWVFSRARADDASAGIVRATQEACPPDVGTCPASGVGEWTHVVAVYDDVARTMTLHINGEAVDTVSYTDRWTPRGPLYLGGALHGAEVAGLFQGDLDEVRVYDRVLAGGEVQDLFLRNPTLAGRWRLDGASGTPAVTPEAAGVGPGATLNGDAGFAPGIIGFNNALSLDGVGDWAATAEPPFNSRGSWSVSAWVSAPGRPQRDSAVLSLADSHNSAFVVRYVPDPSSPETAGRWQLDIAQADGSTATHFVTEHTNYQLSLGWNHLAVVYDSFADQMLLYVNGELLSLGCGDDDTDGCTDVVSWRSEAWPFEADGGLQIGRARVDGAWGEYWSGAIDDVWAFRGVLSEDAVRRLAYSARDEDINTP